jgi:hypothetical protein
MYDHFFLKNNRANFNKKTIISKIIGLIRAPLVIIEN